MSVITYAKEHPIATGAVVIIGGILFIMIVRGGGSSGSSAAPSGPSDAQIAASTAIEVAKINQQGAAAQAGAAIQAAQVGAGVQMNSDNKAAEVAMRQLEIYKELGIAQTTAQKEAVGEAIAAQNARNQAIIGSLGNVKKKNRDDVLQALITGQPYYPQSNPGNSAAAIIGSVGQAAGSIAALFSDDRLKENIRYYGRDKNGKVLYAYNYRGSKKTRVGYMAAEVARSDPKSVIKDNDTGYLKVLPKAAPDPFRNDGIF